MSVLNEVFGEQKGGLERIMVLMMMMMINVFFQSGHNQESIDRYIGTHRKNKQQQTYWPLRGCL